MKVRKIGGYWIAEASSSNVNRANAICWVEEDDPQKCELTIYIDARIFDVFKIPGAGRIGWLAETYEVNHRVIYFLTQNLEQARARFTYIFTFLEDLLALGPPFARCIPGAVPWIAWPDLQIYAKTRLVSMIASRKTFFAGHRHRLEWVEILQDKVDLYGHGRERELVHKVDGLRDYMFTVAIENDNSDFYFTEKITDAFATGTVPIYWGSRGAVERHFDPKGVIFLEDDPELSTLSADLYAEMLPSVVENFRRVVHLLSVEKYLYEEYLSKCPL